MERTRAVALAAGVLVALLFVTVATSEPARFTERQPSLPWELPELELDIPTTTTADGLQPGEVRPSRSWEIFSSLLKWVLLAVLAYLTYRLLRWAWRHRPRLVWRRRSSHHEIVPLVELRDLIAADAAEQSAALRTGGARNAIVACWLRLEAVVERAGLEHDPALTSAELTAEVLARFEVDPAPAGRLAALYREARFSSHPMGESHRSEAITALDAIHAGLARSTDGVSP